MVRYVEQSFEILNEDLLKNNEMLKLIEKAGRTCYKSEDRITDDSAVEFVKHILERGHESVIEHVSISVKFITNRGMTHELVRHRLASYSQESTRYCNYGKEKHGNQITVIDQRDLICKQFDCRYVKDSDVVEYIGKGDNETAAKMNKYARGSVDEWSYSMEDSEDVYLSLLRFGLSPQFARGVLPIDLKTEIIITANVREWRHIFKLRTSESAHPNIQFIMRELCNRMKESIPVLFDDIVY